MVAAASHSRLVCWSCFYCIKIPSPTVHKKCINVYYGNNYQPLQGVPHCATDRPPRRARIARPHTPGAFERRPRGRAGARSEHTVPGVRPGAPKVRAPRRSQRPDAPRDDADGDGAPAVGAHRAQARRDGARAAAAAALRA